MKIRPRNLIITVYVTKIRNFDLYSQQIQRVCLTISITYKLDEIDVVYHYIYC